jgi:predicted NBD/HSP70 family sugar kinase/transcriptional regulator with XRE-family HTH domain
MHRTRERLDLRAELANIGFNRYCEGTSEKGSTMPSSDRRTFDLDWLRRTVHTDDDAEAVYKDAKRRENFLASLRRARKQIGLDQQAVATAMGTTQSSISDLENGRVDPRLSTLQRYARALKAVLGIQIDSDGYADMQTEAEGVGLGLVLTGMLPFQEIHTNQLAHQLRLPPSLVRRAVAILVTNEWVISGLDPEVVKLNHDRAWALGLCIRPEGVTGVRTDLRAETESVVVHRPLREAHPKSVVEVAAHVVADLVAGSAGDRPILGLGVDIAGIVDGKAGVVRYAADFPGVTGWTDFDLAGELLGLTGMTTVITNDANALANREHLRGGDRGGVLVLRLSERGIGAGTIANGAVLTGRRDAAGELGHVIIDPSGPLCRSGMHQGCLESLASAEAIVRAATNSSKADPDDLPMVAQQATVADSPAARAFAKAGEALGTVLATAAALHDPARIVVYGLPELTNVADFESARLLVSRMNDAMEQRAGFIEKCEIEARTMQTSTCPRAAASVAIRRFLARPTEWLPQGEDMMQGDAFVQMASIAEPEFAQ